MIDQQRILTVTLNPALDVYTHVPRLVPQVKLRCSDPQVDPGGGGVNVSRVIHELGGTSTAFMALGGATGAQLAGLLDAAGIATHIFPAEGETRTSFTVMEDETRQHYRFVLPGPPQPDNAEAIRRSVACLFAESDIVVLTGSLLPGLPEDFYGRLIEEARAAGARTLLDAHGAALKGAVPFRPDILRLNHIEATELLGYRAAGDLQKLAEALLREEVAESVIVSRGAEGTAVASKGATHRFRPPDIAVRSSVGAGDSFVGAFVLAIARGRSIIEAATVGVAAAASAVLAEGTGLCGREETERMVSLVSVESPAPAL